MTGRRGRGKGNGLKVAKGAVSKVVGGDRNVVGEALEGNENVRMVEARHDKGGSSTCSVCVKVVLDGDQGIACDSCHDWYHLVCQGIPEILYEHMGDIPPKDNINTLSTLYNYLPFPVLTSMQNKIQILQKILLIINKNYINNRPVYRQQFF